MPRAFLDNEKVLFNMFRYSTFLIVIVTSIFLAIWHWKVSAKHLAILTGYATWFSNLVKQLVTWSLAWNGHTTVLYINTKFVQILMFIKSYRIHHNDFNMKAILLQLVFTQGPTKLQLSVFIHGFPPDCIFSHRNTRQPICDIWHLKKNHCTTHQYFWLIITFLLSNLCDYVEITNAVSVVLFYIITCLAHLAFTSKLYYFQ